MWVSASNGGLKTWLVHRQGTRWTRVNPPFAVNVGSITADGNGGIYVAAQGSNRFWRLHRTRLGRWSRIQTPPATVVRIPGTTALWGVGAIPTTTGGNAVIWAYGHVG